MGAVVSAYENAYYQYQTGMLDADRWEIQRTDLVRLFEYPGVVEWRKNNRISASPAFLDLVSEILGEKLSQGKGRG